MKTIQDNINQWLLREAHLVAGHAFLFDGFSCLPVWRKDRAYKSGEAPTGFLLSHGQEVHFFDAHTPEGEVMLSAWSKSYILELMEETEGLPSEYWYG